MSGPNRLEGRRIAAQLEELGWRVVHSGHSHFKAYCPCGVHMVVLSSTSSDTRGRKNTKAMIKRFLRDCPATPSSD
jgi:predicted RNA binding protein YcfA (HicA-like mRNA interferase family)